MLNTRILSNLKLNIQYLLVLYFLRFSILLTLDIFFRSARSCLKNAGRTHAGARNLVCLGGGLDFLMGRFNFVFAHHERGDLLVVQYDEVASSGCVWSG